MYIITYRSYKTFTDKEVYNSKEIADKRYSQLKACPVVDNLKMREV